MSKTFKDEPGFITARNSAVLYNGVDAGFDIKDGKWVLFCTDHGTVIHETNKQRAVKRLKGLEWCKGCNREPEQPMRILEDKSVDQDQEMRFWAKRAQNDPEKCKLFQIMYGVSPDQFWD